MPKTQAKLHFRIGDVHGAELSHLINHKSEADTASGFTALPLSDQQNITREVPVEDRPQADANKRDRTNRHGALDRLRHLNNLAGKIGKIIIGDWFNNKN